MDECPLFRSKQRKRAAGTAVGARRTSYASRQDRPGTGAVVRRPRTSVTTFARARSTSMTTGLSEAQLLEDGLESKCRDGSPRGSCLRVIEAKGRIWAGLMWSLNRPDNALKTERPKDRKTERSNARVRVVASEQWSNSSDKAGIAKTPLSETQSNLQARHVATGSSAERRRCLAEKKSLLVPGCVVAVVINITYAFTSWLGATLACKIVVRLQP